VTPDPVPYSPIVDRPRITWPGGARVAFWIGHNVEFYEYMPPVNRHRAAWGRVPAPDVRSYAWRDYGNRVGFWRMLEVFDHFAIRPTVSLNVAVLDHFPELRDAMVERDWELMSHGLFNTRFLFGLEPDEERELIGDTIETVRRQTGRPLKGMFGPHASITPNTMNLMAEAGLIYSADWYLDDQPFPIATRTGRLVGVPYTWELNDGLMMTAGFGRGIGTSEAEGFVQAAKDQFDVLYEEGAESGRVLCLALHTSIFGQPYRTAYLAQALEYILRHDGVWAATADEIAEHYLQHTYDEAVARLP
jgi:peptidoglycan/xylan/chitin deacetylase (PgdA/CDA1 family)